MRVAVSGATGTIGRALVAALLERGDEVSVLSRRADGARQALGEVEAFGWPDPAAGPPPAEALAGREGVVHLAGEPLAQRWTDEAKRRIRESRTLGTRNLVSALGELPAEQRPSVLVSQSASGFYGARGEDPVDEEAAAGGGFLAEVVRGWEDEARRAEELGLRVVLSRTGVVLAPSGGALQKMLPFFRLGIGGPVAGGRQYVPWIHLDDAVGAILFCLDRDDASGPINVAAPQPATNAELSRTLGRVLRRPAVAPVPAFALQLLYGEMASVVTTGVREVPRRLGQLGYRFRRPELEPALRAALGR